VAWATKDLKAGVIGTDTSHVPRLPTSSGRIRSGDQGRRSLQRRSPDLPASADRVEKFAATMRDKHHVELVGSIEELLPKVDVVLLQSLDGRVHLAQATPVLKAGKRLFIDKPLAASVEDARRIVNCRSTRHAVFQFLGDAFARTSCGSATIRRGKVLKSRHLSLWKVKDHPDLAQYGIHGSRRYML